jgi:hypothetical protein
VSLTFPTGQTTAVLYDAAGQHPVRVIFSTRIEYDARMAGGWSDIHLSIVISDDQSGLTPRAAGNAEEQAEFGDVDSDEDFASQVTKAVDKALIEQRVR